MWEKGESNAPPDMTWAAGRMKLPFAEMRMPRGGAGFGGEKQPFTSRGEKFKMLLDVQVEIHGGSGWMFET